MTIYTNSRYSGEAVVRMTSDRGTVPTVFRSPPPFGARFLHYTVAQGDRFDILAYRFLGDSTLWWMIADANPENFYPVCPPVGATIRIPQGG